MSERKLLSNRVQYCPSIEDLLDQWVPGFGQKFNLTTEQEVEFRELLRKCFDNLLWQASSAVELGTQKGIQEAFALMRDPSFYETVKRRRQKQREDRKPKPPEERIIDIGEQ